MECTFDSLPFLFAERERASLLAWRKEAGQRERRQAARRAEQLQQLQQYVSSRLAQRQGQPLPLSRRQDAPLSVSDFTPELGRRPLGGTLSDFTPELGRRPLGGTLSDFTPELGRRPLGGTLSDSSLSLTHDGGSEEATETPPPHDLPCPPQQSQVSREHSSYPEVKPISSTNEGGRQWKTVENPAGPRTPPGDVYARLTALGRGFLTRRLLQSNKICNLLKTIKDGSAVLAEISDPVSQQDAALRDRVQTQMQLARLTLHEVLELPTAERMAYIAHTRLLKHQRRDRGGSGSSRGRLSTATQKAIERRQQKSTASSIPVCKTGRLPGTLVKPVSVQDRTKLQQDKPMGREGTRVRPVRQATGQRGAASRIAHPAVQDKLKPRKIKTVPSRVSGQGNPQDKWKPLSGQPTPKSGQTKSGQDRLAGHQRQQTQPLRKPAQAKSTAKTRTSIRPLHT